jgi:hypothetical protein
LPPMIAALFGSSRQLATGRCCCFTDDCRLSRPLVQAVRALSPMRFC